MSDRQAVTKKKVLTCGGNNFLHLSLTRGAKENADSFEAARDEHSDGRRGREKEARGVSRLRRAFVQKGRCGKAARPVSTPAAVPHLHLAPGLTRASKRSRLGLCRGSRLLGPTQRPGSQTKRCGPARPRPGLTQPLRRLQPRLRSPTAVPRPVAATAAAIAPPFAAAAVAPAPAALTTLTPPGAAAKPAGGSRANPAPRDTACARTADRMQRALRRQRERVTLAGVLSSHVAPAAALVRLYRCRYCCSHLQNEATE